MLDEKSLYPSLSYRHLFSSLPLAFIPSRSKRNFIISCNGLDYHHSHHIGRPRGYMEETLPIYPRAAAARSPPKHRHSKKHAKILARGIQSRLEEPRSSASRQL